MRIFDVSKPLTFDQSEELYFMTTDPNFTRWQRLVKWFYRLWHLLQAGYLREASLESRLPPWP